MEPSLSFAPQKKHRQGAAEALRILYSGYLTIEIDDKAFLKPYKKKKNTGTERRKGISGTGICNERIAYSDSSSSSLF